ncbi:MAG: caspase family protein, partial [Dehalococcoidales bacterium]|nr:caspase family protein [Dehalococcoidales bacterium]
MNKLLSRVSVAVFLALVLLIVVTLVLPVASAQADSITECWAVLAGVSDYKYNIGDLSYCDDDVRDFSNILSPVWGADHVRTLIDSQASKANILNNIDWLASNAGPEDTVLFYFSGHGADYQDGYFCPYDSLTYSWANDVSSSELAAAFQPVQAGKIVVILDICHAGEFQANMGIGGRVIMMACRSYETSQESWLLRNGVYTYYILEAMDNFSDADTNNDNELSAEEVADYAGPLATDYNSSQHPQLYDGYYGGLALLARFIFTLNTSLPFGTTVLTLDGTDYTSAPAPMIWIPGVSHTISVPQLVDPGSGTRYVFTQWDDGYVTVTRTITHGSYTASYDKEHL